MDFNIARIINLMRRDFIVHKKEIAWLIFVMLMVCGLMFFMTHDGDNQSNNVPPDAGELVFAALLLVLGSFFTASVYREFKFDENRLQYLTMPASNFEKLFAKWFYTLPLYFMIVGIVFLFGYMVFVPIVEYITDSAFVPFSELQFKYFGYWSLAYVIAHGVILFLAIHFNKYPIPKIIVTGFVVMLLSVLCAAILFRIVFWDHFSGLFYPTEVMQSSQVSDEFKHWAESLFVKLPYIVSATAVPFLWVVTYFRMKEKEV